MTQVHFTLNQEDIQNIINESVADELSKNILTKVFNELMEMQRDQYIGVGEYERGEQRRSQRNGYYQRDYTTQVETLNLNVPRTRDGKFSTDLFERYQRNEKALIANMLEMYIQGVSTRKVTKIVEELCGKKVSKSFVSNLTKELDEIEYQWQYRELSKEYPYLMADVIYIKVRENKQVISKLCHIAIGISKGGDKEILGFLIQEGESEKTWANFFNYLKERGLREVKLVISDAHKGIVKANRRSKKSKKSSIRRI